MCWAVGEDVGRGVGAGEGKCSYGQTFLFWSTSQLQRHFLCHAIDCYNSK